MPVYQSVEQQSNEGGDNEGVSKQPSSDSILELDPSQLTPGMKQYRDIKRAHPDCLVMLRMGDFYEMFYEDAITAARELEITLTARGKGEKRAPLAGVPFHAVDSYLGRLVKKGYKVAIVEQLEDPKYAKGLVKRGLVRIITPGTIMEGSLLNEKENNYIAALTSFGDEFAIACCDLSTGEFFTLSVQTHPQLYNELTRLNPSECVIPESLKVNRELLAKVSSIGSSSSVGSNGCFLTTLEDYYFKAEKAKELLLQHFNLQNLNALGLEERRLNIGVAGALLQYLYTTQKNTLSHLQKLSLRSSGEAMLLDSTTLRNLELLKNMRDGSLRGTLLSILDKTVTAMGARLLKQWLKEPLLDPEKIDERLNVVAILNKMVIGREEIIDILGQISDLERLVSRVNYGNATPREVIALRNSLQQLPQLKIKLQQLLPLSQERQQFQENSLQESSLLQALSTFAFFEPLTTILTAIRDDAPISVREGGIFKNGFNQELDELHSLKTDARRYLQGLEERERQRTGIATLKIGYTEVFGYFIEITKKNLALAPSDYIRKQTTANSERYITPELSEWEEKILGAEEKSVELEYSLFQQILQKIREQTVPIQDAAQKIAMVDVLCSFSKIALENNYVRPEIVAEIVGSGASNEDTNNKDSANSLTNIQNTALTAVKTQNQTQNQIPTINSIHLLKSRHPVLEQRERFIANDIIINPGEMMIITGPNMSGKSSLMRQAALTAIMAQMGSFVPAEKAVLSIVDRIFTRIGAFDDLSAGQSTFMVEMSETASILHNATERSLIILDEIGRGTSTFDGVAIAWAVAEHIHNQIKAKTMFSTHYHVLNKLAEKFPRVKNYNLAVKEVKGEIIFLYKLVEGGTDQSYGVHVAKLAGLPFEVVQRAQEIQEILEQEDEMLKRLKARKVEEQISLKKF